MLRQSQTTVAPRAPYWIRHSIDIVGAFCWRIAEADINCCLQIVVCKSRARHLRARNKVKYFTTFQDEEGKRVKLGKICAMRSTIGQLRQNRNTDWEHQYRLRQPKNLCALKPTSIFLFLTRV